MSADLPQTDGIEQCYCSLVWWVISLRMKLKSVWFFSYHLWFHRSYLGKADQLPKFELISNDCSMSFKNGMRRLDNLKVKNKRLAGGTQQARQQMWRDMYSRHFGSKPFTWQSSWRVSTRNIVHFPPQMLHDLNSSSSSPFCSRVQHRQSLVPSLSVGHSSWRSLTLD